MAASRPSQLVVLGIVPYYREGQVDYFLKLNPAKLAPGGILAAHNTIRQAGAMRDYLDLIQRYPTSPRSS